MTEPQCMPRHSGKRSSGKNSRTPIFVSLDRSRTFDILQLGEQQPDNNCREMVRPQIPPNATNENAHVWSGIGHGILRASINSVNGETLEVLKALVSPSAGRATPIATRILSKCEIIGVLSRSVRRIVANISQLRAWQ